MEAALGKDPVDNSEEENKEKEPHEILGVDKDASLTDIKKAYRKLSLQYHPDKQHGKSEEQKKEAETKMREINEAYEKLTGSRCEGQSKEELEEIEREKEQERKTL